MTIKRWPLSVRELILMAHATCRWMHPKIVNPQLDRLPTRITGSMGHCRAPVQGRVQLLEYSQHGRAGWNMWAAGSLPPRVRRRETGEEPAGMGSTACAGSKSDKFWEEWVMRRKEQECYQEVTGKKIPLLQHSPDFSSLTPLSLTIS